MTREEAIKILDPATSRETLLRYEDNEERVEAVDEACQVACAALRAQQTPAKLDRSRWDGCDECRIISISRKMVGLGRKYCHYCGRPLTEEAWAEMERRINRGTADC